MHVFSGDLIERAVAPSSIISVERQPILRLFAGMDDALRCDLLACGTWGCQQKKPKEKHNDADPESAPTPRIRPQFLVRHVVLHSISGPACVSGAKYSPLRPANERILPIQTDRV